MRVSRVCAVLAFWYAGCSSSTVGGRGAALPACQVASDAGSIPYEGGPTCFPEASKPSGTCPTDTAACLFCADSRCADGTGASEMFYDCRCVLGSWVCDLDLNSIGASACPLRTLAPARSLSPSAARCGTRLRAVEWRVFALETSCEASPCRRMSLPPGDFSRLSLMGMIVSLTASSFATRAHHDSLSSALNPSARVRASERHRERRCPDTRRNPHERCGEAAMHSVIERRHPVGDVRRDGRERQRP